MDRAIRAANKFAAFCAILGTHKKAINYFRGLLSTHSAQ